MIATTAIAIEGIIIRLGCDKDLDFIYHSWLHSYRNSYFVQHKKKITPKEKYTFQDEHRKVITALLSKSHVHVLHLEDNHDDLVGYAVFEETKDGLLLHYMYLKNVFRRLGIGTSFFQHIVGHYANGENLESSHNTGYFPKINDKWKLKFNPNLLKGINNYEH